VAKRAVLFQRANAAHTVQRRILIAQGFCGWDLRNPFGLEEPEHGLDLWRRKGGTREVHNDIECGGLYESGSKSVNRSVNCASATYRRGVPRIPLI
jgi:hypothetical protein